MQKCVNCPEPGRLTEHGTLEDHEGKAPLGGRPRPFPTDSSCVT